MEDKKEIKVSLSTVLLIIAIILIGVMGVFMYMQKTESDRQIAELENNASKLQETINDLQGKIDTISNTINSNKDVNNNSAEDTKYVELTKELNSGDVLYITKAEKNSDNTYTLYGVVFDCNENVNPDYQISDTWTVTKDYKKVTVSSDTKCISGYPEEEETTVGKCFNNYGEVELEKVVENTTLTDKYTYSFKFENGKCVEVIDYCTGV